MRYRSENVGPTLECFQPFMDFFYSLSFHKSMKFFPSHIDIAFIGEISIKKSIWHVLSQNFNFSISKNQATKSPISEQIIPIRSSMLFHCIPTMAIEKRQFQMYFYRPHFTDTVEKYQTLWVLRECCVKN